MANYVESALIWRNRSIHLNDVHFSFYEKQLIDKNISWKISVIGDQNFFRRATTQFAAQYLEKFLQLLLRTDCFYGH